MDDFVNLIEKLRTCKYGRFLLFCYDCEHRFVPSNECRDFLLREAADAVEKLISLIPTREKLIEILSQYFEIGDSYTYDLTRVKEAFEIGTMTFDDFHEWSEKNVADLADFIMKKLRKPPKVIL